MSNIENITKNLNENDKIDYYKKECELLKNEVNSLKLTLLKIK
jgi:hypothetical protein